MTSSPKTLLQFAGAPLHASPLEKSAIVIIDAQMEYVTGKLPLDGIDAAMAETERLLALGRKHGLPIFHIVQHSAPGRPLFDPEGPYAAIPDNLTPIVGEKVVIKKLPNSFAGTELHSLVQETGRTELIVAGFMTHMCVSATVRAALDLGYRTTVVASAVTTRDLPDALGDGVIPAATIHRATLAALADRFAVIVPDVTALEANTSQHAA